MWTQKERTRISSIRFSAEDKLLETMEREAKPFEGEPMKCFFLCLLFSWLWSLSLLPSFWYYFALESNLQYNVYLNWRKIKKRSRKSEESGEREEPVAITGSTQIWFFFFWFSSEKFIYFDMKRTQKCKLTFIFKWL